MVRARPVKSYEMDAWLVISLGRWDFQVAFFSSVSHLQCGALHYQAGNSGEGEAI